MWAGKRNDCLWEGKEGMGMTLDTEEVERNVCLWEGDEGRGMTVRRLGRVKGMIAGREGGKRNDCLWEGKKGMHGYDCGYGKRG